MVGNRTVNNLSYGANRKAFVNHRVSDLSQLCTLSYHTPIHVTSFSLTDKTQYKYSPLRNKQFFIRRTNKRPNQVFMSTEYLIHSGISRRHEV